MSWARTTFELDERRGTPRRESWHYVFGPITLVINLRPRHGKQPSSYHWEFRIQARIIAFAVTDDLESAKSGAEKTAFDWMSDKFKILETMKLLSLNSPVSSSKIESSKTI